jgi:hypothetical protein
MNRLCDLTERVQTIQGLHYLSANKVHLAMETY